MNRQLICEANHVPARTSQRRAAKRRRRVNTAQTNRPVESLDRPGGEARARDGTATTSGNSSRSSVEHTEGNIAFENKRALCRNGVDAERARITEVNP
jgi:hypothetical protein